MNQHSKNLKFYLCSPYIDFIEIQKTFSYIKKIFPFLEILENLKIVRICLFTAIIDTCCVMHKIYIMDRCQFERQDWIMKHYERKKKLYIYISTSENDTNTRETYVHGFISVRRTLLSSCETIMGFQYWHVIIMPAW